MVPHDRSRSPLYDRCIYRKIPQVQFVGYLEQSTRCHLWDMDRPHNQWLSLAYRRSGPSESESDVRGRSDVNLAICSIIWLIFPYGICISLSREEERIKIWFYQKSDIMPLTSKEDYDKLGNRPPKKNTRSSGCFSVIDIDGEVSVYLDLSLFEWQLCIQKRYRDIWGGSSYDKLVKK